MKKLLMTVSCVGLVAAIHMNFQPVNAVGGDEQNEVPILPKNIQKKIFMELDRQDLLNLEKISARDNPKKRKINLVALNESLTMILPKTIQQKVFQQLDLKTLCWLARPGVLTKPTSRLALAPIIVKIFYDQALHQHRRYENEKKSMEGMDQDLLLRWGGTLLDDHENRLESILMEENTLCKKATLWISELLY